MGKDGVHGEGEKDSTEGRKEAVTASEEVVRSHLVDLEEDGSDGGDQDTGKPAF